jgi:phage terminase large subunit-like protein
MDIPELREKLKELTVRVHRIERAIHLQELRRRNVSIVEGAKSKFDVGVFLGWEDGTYYVVNPDLNWAGRLTLKGGRIEEAL